MKDAKLQVPDGIQFVGRLDSKYEKILTPEALRFAAELHREFNDTRKHLLEVRRSRQREIDGGKLPDFLPETAHIRNGDWKVAPIPEALQDRRVEITGPASNRRMVINALNSGAKIYMPDLEDANSPTWENSLEGQLNLYDAVRREITYTSPEGKHYALNDETAIMMVRPRGLHLVERHMLVDGEPISASIFDFSLFFFHNAKRLLQQGRGPFFYLPKLESHLEARLWNSIFVSAQNKLGIPQGSIKATCLIETILAAFEMDEILYELREHSAGLNCGRWDYIFSMIKKFRNHPDYLLPDRSQVTMTVPCMRSYTRLAIHTCHKRGIHCIGGMAAQIPIKDNPKANEEALQKVREDKLREVMDGHDGTWVAHPGLVPVAMAVFDEHMPEAHQIHRLDHIQVTAKNLLEVPTGTITEEGLRLNISVAIQYIEAWLRGNGAVPINHLMEDAATAEISRAQIWHWIRHADGKLQDGRKITLDLFFALLVEEMEKIRQQAGNDRFGQGKYYLAAQLLIDMTVSDDFIEFLTLPGYEFL